MKDNRLLGEPAKVAVGEHARVFGDGLFLDARPREVDVEEEQEDAEADDGWLCGRQSASVRSPLGDLGGGSGKYIKLVSISHQRIVQQVSIYLEHVETNKKRINMTGHSLFYFFLLLRSTNGRPPRNAPGA